MGLPPRVRSRRLSASACNASMGITSACAEQTIGRTVPPCARRDYLRVCGADLGLAIPPELERGLPPRVRSRRHPNRMA